MNLIKIFGIEKLSKAVLQAFLLDAVREDTSGARAFGRALTVSEKDCNAMCNKLNITNLDDRRAILASFRAIGEAAEKAVTTIQVRL